MTGLSCELLQAYDENRVDAVIAKKDGRAQRGRVFWREPLVWMASADYRLDFSGPAPLVMLRAPCTYRELMITALDSVRCEWTSVCTASSLMGVQAAVAGGLGITVLGKSFVREGMQILRVPENWPPLPMTEIVAIGESSKAAQLLEPLVAFLTESLAASEKIKQAI